MCKFTRIPMPRRNVSFPLKNCPDCDIVCFQRNRTGQGRQMVPRGTGNLLSNLVQPNQISIAYAIWIVITTQIWSGLTRFSKDFSCVASVVLLERFVSADYCKKKIFAITNELHSIILFLLTIKKKYI